jgi:hypothetical protein
LAAAPGSGSFSFHRRRGARIVGTWPTEFLFEYFHVAREPADD